MNYQEAIELLDSKNIGLNSDAVNQLLGQMNNPQKELKFVVVTGSVMRKSCAHMIAKTLQSTGYKTGLYQSSYFMTCNERLAVNGEVIENNDLVSLADATKAASELIDEKPTTDDSSLSSAIVYFKDFECEVVVIEAKPIQNYIETIMDCIDVSCLVIVDSDGLSIKDIINKAGIKNVPVVIDKAEDEAGENCIVAGKSVSMFDSFEGQSFEYDGTEYALAVAGTKQIVNAVLAIEACNILKNKGLKIQSQAVEEGIYSAPCPAAFEMVCDEPYFLLDNVNSADDIKYTSELINKYFPNSQMQIILSLNKDSEWENMVDSILNSNWEYIVSGNDDSVDWKEIASYIESKGLAVTGCETNDDAISVAIDAAGDFGTICAIGNESLCGVVRSYYGLGGKNL